MVEQNDDEAVTYVNTETVLDTSAKCKSVRKQHANLPDTSVDLTGAPK
jgi:hypothetical protein